MQTLALPDTLKRRKGSPPKKAEASKTLALMLEHMSAQASNSAKMDKDQAYYDGDQETEEMATYRRSMGEQSYCVNLVKETINSVLGTEEKRRVDWLVKPDQADDYEVAEALNVELNEVMRLHDANHHCSEAYKAMAVKGIGWLYFGKSTDPLGLPYELSSVPNSEIISDLRSRRIDLKDCRYIAMRRWMDKDEAKAHFSQHAELIENTFSRLDAWDATVGGYTMAGNRHTGVNEGQYLEHLYQHGQHQLVAVIEMYYRSWEERLLLFWNNSDRTPVEYDPDKPEHVEARFLGEAQAKKKTISIMRNAWFIGPDLISDDVSPHPHNMFPFVRLQGYRNDKTGEHSGLVREMISPQDAYNEANIKSHYLADKIFVMYEEGALGEGITERMLQAQVHRADGLVRLAPNAMGRVKIDTRLAEIDRLEQIMVRSRGEIRAVSGISDSFSGNNVEQQSGVAIANLAEMSAATLAEFNANYMMGRRMLGRLVMAHVYDKIGTQQYPVDIKNEVDTVRKTVVLNEPHAGGLRNSLLEARLQVSLDDVRTAEGYRAQQEMRLTEMLQQVPDQYKMPFLRMIMMISDVPHKQQLLEELNRIDGRGNTEAETRQLQQDRAQADQAAQALEARNIAAEAAYSEARAQKAQAEAQKIMADMGMLPAANEAQAQAMQAEQAQAQQQAKDAERAEKLQLIDEARAAIASRATAA